MRKSKTPQQNRGLGFEGLAQANQALVLAACAIVGVLQEEQESRDTGLGEVGLTESLRSELRQWLEIYSPDAEWPGKKEG